MLLAAQSSFQEAAQFLERAQAALKAWVFATGVYEMQAVGKLGFWFLAC